MGLLKGKANMVKFKVEGDLPEQFMEYIQGRIESFCFVDIDDKYDSYSIGWTDVEDMCLPPVKPIVGTDVFLGLRIDERKVNGSVLKKYIAKEETNYRARHNIPKIGRALKVEIKANVKAKLEREEKPKPTFVELWWNLTNNEVVFFSTSQALITVIEDFFKECFGLTLVRYIPYFSAKEEVEENALLSPKSLENLFQSIFI